MADETRKIVEKALRDILSRKTNDNFFKAIRIGPKWYDIYHLQNSKNHPITVGYYMHGDTPVVCLLEKGWIKDIALLIRKIEEIEED